MQYGCCTKVLENRGEPAVYRGSLIKACGYTYAELPMYRLMELSDSQIRTLRDEMKELGLSFESSNCFYPASMRLTGAGIDMGAILDYAARAFELAASLGIRAIVLGSPVSRTVPAGFSKAAAREQLAEALTGMSKLCAPLGVDVAFEACNIYINNLIVNLDEALELCRDVNSPGIGLVADYYHLALANEDPKIIEKGKQYIHHVHFGNPAGTPFPIAEIVDTYMPFVQSLKRARYDRCFTVEEHDCPPSEADMANGYKVLLEFDQYFRSISI